MTALIPPLYYTLRFSSFEEARSVCEDHGFWRSATEDLPEGPISDGQIRGPDGIRGFSIQIIGLDPIHPDGTQLTGFYVNVAGLLPAALALHMVEYGCTGVWLGE